MATASDPAPPPHVRRPRRRAARLRRLALRRALALQRWLRDRDWDEGALLLAAGAVIGLAAGLGVVLFYELIDASYLAFTVWPERHLRAIGTALLRPVLTAVAVWAAWLLVRRFRVGAGQNVPDIQLAVAKRGGVVPLRPVLVRTLASAITLGGGGSVGSEGPVAVLGAGVGSAIGRVLRLPTRYVKILVGCGAAGGIAGAFGAPFAGAFFALEEVLGSFSVGAFSPVVISSVVGALTVRAALGSHPAFHLPREADAHPIANAMLYPLLGIACGLVSALYAQLDLAVPRLMRRLPGPEWVRPLVGGAIAGLLVLASGGLLAGNGHLAIPRQVFGGLAWYALIGLALAKLLATVITLGSGGSGGVFTPALFIGASLGGGLGVLAQRVLPGHIVHPAAWALVGMGGLVAGATRAPLTAIFMVFELTNDSSFVIPLMIVAVVAFVTARHFSPHGLYDGWLAARGEHIAHGVDEGLMERLRVGDALVNDAPRVDPGADIAHVLDLMARSRLGAVAVVAEDGTLIGLVGQHEVREALVRGASLRGLLVAEDLAEPVTALRPTQTLREALGLMSARGRDALPVLEPGSSAGRARFMGLVDRASVLALYERELEHQV